MDRGPNLKPVPRRIALFCGNNEITKAAARYIQEESPQTQIRLVIRQEKHRSKLEAQFPGVEIAMADYFDLPSLEKAVKGVQGLFVVTPDFMDEQRAMTNLIYAVRTNPAIVHIVRFMGELPGMTEKRMPTYIKTYSGGPHVQHMVARKILEDTDLPITYINCAANFFQNFTSRVYNASIRQHRILAVPRNRRLGFIDKADTGRCAGALLLSPNHRHIGQTYQLDNNNDVLWFDELAVLMSEVFGEEIRYDGSDEAFLRLNGPSMKAGHDRENADQFGVDLFQFEKDSETVWRKSDIVEYLTGRKPVTLREWLAANRDAVLNGPQAT
ncbi:MAG TPA: NmrA family NAD(P)-binding protein [Bradyrhizobium sp.]|nr:NmrA family NAD(P)-binding protein [Bradyrhizobium sp.]